MNITDKINPKGISDKTWSDTPTKHIYEYGVTYILNHITPKVAIDFAKWCSSWDWSLVQEGYWMNPDCPPKTSEELFQEFLKDYNFESI